MIAIQMDMYQQGMQFWMEWMNGTMQFFTGSLASRDARG
jgi:hypothetical protein